MNQLTSPDQSQTRSPVTPPKTQLLMANSEQGCGKILASLLLLQYSIDACFYTVTYIQNRGVGCGEASQTPHPSS